MQKFLYAIAAFFALLIVVGLALPSQSRLEVSTTIDAYPATVFALVNDFRRVNLWAPKAATDPDARLVYSGPDRGVGATLSWDGPVIGSGTQTIDESRPFDYVATTINKGEPGEASTWFTIAAGPSTTNLTWGFSHDYGLNLVGRYFALMLNGILRREHEAGLAGLKDLAESLPRTDFSDLDIQETVVEAMPIAYVRTTSTREPAAVSEAMGKAYFEILSFIDDHGLAEAGAPLSIKRSYSGARLTFDAAIPVTGVTDATPADGSRVRIGSSYAGTVIRATHVGSYRTLGETHRKITAYLAALGFERLGDAWESYVGDPASVAEEDLLTYIYYPVKTGV